MSKGQLGVGIVATTVREDGLDCTEGLGLQRGSKPFMRGLAFQLLASLQEGGLWGCPAFGGGGRYPACLRAVALDLRSCCLLARTFHCSPGPSTAPGTALSPAARLWLLRLMTAHPSSGSLGSSGACSHPPDTVDVAVFDLHVPEW